MDSRQPQGLLPVCPTTWLLHTFERPYIKPAPEGEGSGGFIIVFGHVCGGQD